jgi:hypothetical protein
MSDFNAQQLRLWRGMVKSIGDFRRGELRYYDLVGALEAALDAGDFKNRGLVENWYDFWTPLESVRAQKGNDVSLDEVGEYLSNLETFLKSQLLRYIDES